MFNDWAAVAFIELLYMMCLCYCNPELWSSPSMKGSRPPCSGFSLTVSDDDQAVMFGGDTPSGESSEAYILHLPTMVSC